MQDTIQLFPHGTEEHVPSLSESLHASPNPLLHRQRDQILTNTDIHRPNPHALINDIPTLQPLPKTLLPLPSPQFDFPHTRLLNHQELSDLHELVRRDTRLDDLARLLQTRFERIDDNDAPFIRVLVMVMFMVRTDGLAQNVGMDFAHVGTVAAYRADISAFFSPFGAGEVFSREERGGAGRAEEDDVGFADVFFQQSLVLAVLGGDDAERQFRVRVAEGLPIG